MRVVWKEMGEAATFGETNGAGGSLNTLFDFQFTICQIDLYIFLLKLLYILLKFMKPKLNEIWMKILRIENVKKNVV